MPAGGSRCLNGAFHYDTSHCKSGFLAKWLFDCRRYPVVTAFLFLIYAAALDEARKTLPEGRGQIGRRAEASTEVPADVSVAASAETCEESSAKACEESSAETCEESTAKACEEVPSVAPANAPVRKHLPARPAVCVRSSIGGGLLSGMLLFFFTSVLRPVSESIVQVISGPREMLILKTPVFG